MTTPGGHHRFRLQDVERLAGDLPQPWQPLDLVRSSVAARLLGVSQDTVNRAAREGRLPSASVTPGGHRRFATSQLVAGMLNANVRREGGDHARG